MKLEPAHRHALGQFLADLCERFAWDGPLAPFLVRSILPEPAGAPAAVTPESEDKFRGFVEKQHILTALMRDACKDIRDDCFDGSTPPLRLDSESTGACMCLPVCAGWGAGGAGAVHTIVHTCSAATAAAAAAR
jgi:hypothetical protein